MRDIRTGLAEFIRAVDGSNQLGPQTLGLKIGRWIAQAPGDYSDEIQDYVVEINPAKQLGAARLADAVVDRFGLDEDTAA